ncbi:hypothetical protein FA13DRAFT_1716367 [Coprinellus micaceus]|uniref:Uncharacterized protein n=1 Tax=Coprinellus micaceus TaxID=71717 RepID=A0A4Y7SJT4_COPMI|nr:hypothetical protein FA13DRAFT_1716367 [Coprinellus micaceus]
MCQPPPLTNGGMSQVGVYEGSAGVPPAHRVGVVVVAGHGKGNSGASVDGFSEAQVVGRSTDMQSGERRAVRGQQRWWVGRRTFRVGSGVLCTDNSGASVDGFSEVQVVGRSTDMQTGERRAVRGQQRMGGVPLNKYVWGEVFLNAHSQTTTAACRSTLQFQHGPCMDGVSVDARPGGWSMDRDPTRAHRASKGGMLNGGLGDCGKLRVGRPITIWKWVKARCGRPLVPADRVQPSKLRPLRSHHTPWDATNAGCSRSL